MLSFVQLSMEVTCSYAVKYGSDVFSSVKFGSSEPGWISDDKIF